MREGMDGDVAVRRRSLPVGAQVLKVEHQPLVGEAMLKSETTRAMYAWYMGNSVQGPAPWALFDFLDHFAVAENLFLVHTEQPQALQITLHGENVKRLLGESSWTREILTADVDMPAKRSLFNYYTTIIREGRPYYCEIFGRGGYIHNRHFESIDLPLVDDAGKVIRILGVLGVVEGD